jgi:hypothetical protein
MSAEGLKVRVTYVDYYGRSKDYVIVPVDICLEKVEPYAKPTWMLEAVDMDGKGELRKFAMKNIFNWEELVE